MPQALKAFIFFTLIFVPAIAGAHGIELQNWDVGFEHVVSLLL